MLCVCDGNGWACVESDDKGKTACPVVRQPGPNDPCPANGGTCTYALLPIAMALCYCREDTETGGAAGAAGAGGAEASPPSIWSCAL